MGGDEVLRRVKRHQLLGKIPVFIVSSSSSELDLHAAHEEHANGWIVKPNGVHALGPIVDRIENRRADHYFLSFWQLREVWS